MFTTVKALRNSSAQQNRVSQVENFMKRNYPGFNETTLIPIFMVGVSNTEADMEWVATTNSVQVNLPNVSVVLQKIKAKINEILDGKGTKETKRRALTEEYVRAWRASGRKDEFAAAAGAEYAWFIKELPTVGVAPTDVPHDAAGAAAIAAAPAVSNTVTGRTSSATVTKSAPPKTGKAYAAIPSEKKEKVAPVKAAPVKKAAPVAKVVAPKAPAVPKLTVKAPPPAPVAIDLKGKPLAKAVVERVTRLTNVSSSKDKRSQVIEGLGVTFADVLTALAQVGKLKTAQAEALITKFK